MGRITDTRDSAEVALSLTHPQGGDGVRRINLRVEDTASNLLLLDITLTPEQFTDLIANRHVRAEAKIPNATGRARLFKRYGFESKPVPPEVGTKGDYQYGDRPAKPAVDAWVERVRVDEGWDAATVVTGSQRFYATFERWVED